MAKTKAERRASWKNTSILLIVLAAVMALGFLVGIYDGCTHVACVGGACFIIVLIANKFFTKADTDNDKVNTDTITGDK